MGASFVKQKQFSIEVMSSKHLIFQEFAFFVCVFNSVLDLLLMSAWFLENLKKLQKVGNMFWLAGDYDDYVIGISIYVGWFVIN